MPSLQFSITFRDISEDNLEKFTALAEEAKAITEPEADTLAYDFFLSEDRRTAVLRESFTDAAAMLAHFGGVAHIAQQQTELAGAVQIDVFGEATEELRGALAPFHPNYFGDLVRR